MTHISRIDWLLLAAVNLCGILIGAWIAKGQV